MGLSLNRRPGESILIGEDIIVTVYRSKSTGKITLNIDAPDSVRILRAEVAERDGLMPICLEVGHADV